MSHAKKSVVGLTFLLVGFSGAAWAQDKRPDKAAIIDSFKQEIQDFLKTENSGRGVEHATVASHEASPSDVHIQTHYVKKDGKPCKRPSGSCYEVWADGSVVQYADVAYRKPCSPPDGVVCTRVLPSVWYKAYLATVPQYSFDVTVTDSLVTPYTGVLSYSVGFYHTVDHPTKEEAEQDNNFTPALTSSYTRTYGYQDGEWVLQK